MPLVSLEECLSRSYDYVMISGRTAGLTLTGQLSEDPSVSVLVLEASSFNPDDQLILCPAQFGAHFGQDEYVWQFKTVPQENLAGRQIGWERGKVLGGSSAVNFLAWTNPAKEDIDDWEMLRNTLVNMGIPKAPQPLGGDPHGTFFALNTLDPLSNYRSYSMSFFLQNLTRPNLSVLLNAYAIKLKIRDTEGDLMATGVEFIHGDKSRIACADKEVIVCAGALKTPQILELSGIGPPNILGNAGITPCLDLPVGENVQEHTYVSLSYGRSSPLSYSFYNSYFRPELKDGVPGETLDILGNEIQQQQHIDLQYGLTSYVELIGLTNFSAHGQGVFTMGIVHFTFLSLSDLTSRSSSIYAETVESIKEKIAQGRYPPGAMETLRMQMQKVERNCLDCEIATMPTFFSAPIGALAPFKDVLDEEPVEVNPGLKVQSDEEISAWIRQTLSSTYYTVGTASMLPRDKGGVVDSRLKVYGTTNIRVADLSIAPMHVSHTHNHWPTGLPRKRR
ncbi:GMC oxidoreductase [Armillaria fumosa]|nr:GMC oxidoreductase [Armillaria fumosa]